MRALRADRVGPILVMALSLALLFGVGLGEVSRTYARLEVERLAAEGEVVANGLDPFLAAGLPVEQYAGFATQTRPLLDADRSISAIYLLGAQDQVVDARAQAGVADPSALLRPAVRPSGLAAGGDRFRVAESADFYRVTLELRNKFEPVGELVLVMPRSVVSAEVAAAYTDRVVPAGLALLILFGVVTWHATRRGRAAPRRVGVAYGAVFLAMALVVIAALVGIYGDGVRDKSRALAGSLAARLSAPLSLGLALDDFSHLDAVFAGYRALYPELSFVALTDGPRTILDTDPSRLGLAWRDDPGQYQATASLATAAAAASSLVVHVGVPESAILGQIWRSAKNFAVLFVASAFLARLLFSLLGSVAPAQRATADAEARADYHLRLVEPFLFLAVFVEGLSASFLPVHLDQLARAASVSSGLVSLQFTTYFAAYALSLLPTAGQVERGRAKPILLAATALELASLVALAIATNPWLIFPIRAMAGLAQGMTLTGVQAYYFELLPQEHQTRGSALLGRNYNSALLSAAPIGALLAAYLGVGGTFVAAAGITLAVFVYAAILLPGLAQSRRPGPARGPSFRQSLREVVRDVGLLKGLLLVGIPAKALASGVTGFALPLLLVARSVPTEDVGQILMFYPVGIVLSSMLLARTAGRWGEPSRSLLLGTLGGGVGLVLVGLMGRDASVSTSIPAASILVVIVGLLVLGVAHGFVVGPIVAFVADSRTAGRIGRNPTSSVYRSLERIGHMSGPVVVGQLLILGHGSPTTILWLGVAAIVLGLLFRLGGASAPPVDSPVRVEVG